MEHATEPTVRGDGGSNASTDHQAEKKRFGTLGIVIAVFFGVFIVIFLGGAIFVGAAVRHGETVAAAETASTQGIVEKLSYASESSRWIRYRYTVNGKTFVNSNDVSMDVQPGSVVTVCYAPEKPQTSSLWERGYKCPPH